MDGWQGEEEACTTKPGVGVTRGLGRSAGAWEDPGDPGGADGFVTRETQAVRGAGVREEAWASAALPLCKR